MKRIILFITLSLLAICILVGVLLLWQSDQKAKQLLESASPGIGSDPLSYGNSKASNILVENDKQTNFGEYQKYVDEKNSLIGEIKLGDGAVAQNDSQVAISYKGYLTSGQMFDQSSEPFIFKIGDHKVIPGMEQGVAGMKVGGRRRVIIPPALGYGSQGQGPIPGNAVLIFDLDLIAVQ